MAAKRRWNKDHPIEHAANIKTFAENRLKRIKKHQGIEAARVEKKKQKYERYLKRKAERKPGMFKKLIVKFTGDKGNRGNLGGNRAKNKVFHRKTG